MRTLFPMPSTERLVTAEEFAKIPDDGYRYELVEGRVIRMSPPGMRHAALVMHIGALLLDYVKGHKLGVVIASGGFKLATNPDTVREPDVAFLHRDRIPQSGLPEGFWSGPADLAVEVRSPSDRPSEIRAKVADYLARGVRLVWVVDPKKQTVSIHRPNAASATLQINDEVNGDDILPGFVSTVRRLLDLDLQ
jgi:Uma2 family endonuclease